MAVDTGAEDGSVSVGRVLETGDIADNDGRGIPSEGRGVDVPPPEGVADVFLGIGEGPLDVLPSPLVTARPDFVDTEDELEYVRGRCVTFGALRPRLGYLPFGAVLLPLAVAATGWGIGGRVLSLFHAAAFGVIPALCPLLRLSTW